MLRYLEILLLPCRLLIPIISILLIKGLSLPESIHAFELAFQSRVLAIREIRPGQPNGDSIAQPQVFSEGETVAPTDAGNDHPGRRVPAGDIQDGGGSSARFEVSCDFT